MTVMAVPRPSVTLPTFSTRLRHRPEHARDERVWTPVTDFLASLLTIAILAVRSPQTDSETSGELPRPQVTVPPFAALTVAMRAMAEAFRASGWLPPEPPRGWRGALVRARHWLAGWRDRGTVVARLYLVREWCKTIALMAGCATFLYVCWALVDWIPA